MLEVFCARDAGMTSNFSKIKKGKMKSIRFVSIEVLIKEGISSQSISFFADILPALVALGDKADLIFQAKGGSQDKPLILMGSNC